MNWISKEATGTGYTTQLYTEWGQSSQLCISADHELAWMEGDQSQICCTTRCVGIELRIQNNSRIPLGIPRGQNTLMLDG